ncbi:hypothetical protein Btru_035163 [Bulinus truncatus]|nr:hypothetical protein Btru_035163 [Bulinus truncatus]
MTDLVGIVYMTDLVGIVYITDLVEIVFITDLVGIVYMTDLVGIVFITDLVGIVYITDLVGIVYITDLLGIVYVRRQGKVKCCTVELDQLPHVLPPDCQHLPTFGYLKTSGQWTFDYLKTSGQWTFGYLKTSGQWTFGYLKTSGQWTFGYLKTSGQWTFGYLKTSGQWTFGYLKTSGQWTFGYLKTSVCAGINNVSSGLISANVTGHKVMLLSNARLMVSLGHHSVLDPAPEVEAAVIQHQTVKYDVVALSPLSKHRLSMMKRKVLVLDLDETLIHSHHDGVLRQVKPGTPPDFVLKVTIDRHPVRFFVHKRPHVDFFLEVVSQWYELVVFTASMEIYGAAVADKLDAGKNVLRRRYYRQKKVEYMVLTVNILWLLKAIAQDIILYELYNPVQMVSISAVVLQINIQIFSQASYSSIS